MHGEVVVWFKIVFIAPASSYLDFSSIPKICQISESEITPRKLQDLRANFECQSELYTVKPRQGRTIQFLTQKHFPKLAH